ncbi:hypothetical protein QPK87_23760 [Kamptonema cortianum]|nr:hypothetical protein [Kamptonema cortianum]
MNFAIDSSFDFTSSSSFLRPASTCLALSLSSSNAARFFFKVFPDLGGFERDLFLFEPEMGDFPVPILNDEQLCDGGMHGGYF